MRYYAIVEIDITDQSWVADYVKNVTPMLERHGGTSRALQRSNAWKVIASRRRLWSSSSSRPKRPPKVFISLKNIVRICRGAKQVEKTSFCSSLVKT